ncbi:MAG: phage tail assembly protein [Brevundimonas sp.]|uniref:phage tail assembly protein n=1 Tax=Brevundimonas sp. TaxID=1871086 RepID=UPI00271FAD06|nr:phage tail assembly protein [Brevundimonas sp.]MDO9607211.1 phage tail assembly protein [Brevundimonas sp.]
MNDQSATTSAATDLEEAGYERGVHDNGKAWVRVPLKKPLQRADNKYSSVVLTEPHGSDYQGTSLSFVAQGDYNALITVIPRISDPVIHKQDLQAMKASDLAAISGEVIAFFYTDAQRAALGLTA